jgi:hypothetical protein
MESWAVIDVSYETTPRLLRVSENFARRRARTASQPVQNSFIDNSGIPNDFLLAAA